MTAKSSNRANQTEAQATPQTVQGVLQRKCACGQHTLGKSCSGCSKDDESILKRSTNRHNPAGASAHVPQIVHDVLRSPGTPLDTDARAFMEPRFGRDFSDVRIHTDSRAAQSAGAVGALAYTLGKDIVFGSGNYSPQTREGKSLLAHELTHVAQNRSLQRKHSAGISIGPEDDHYEAEADRNAHAVARGNSDPMRIGAPASEPGRLSRATMAVGATNVDINYSNVVHVKVADYESSIETTFTSWTTSPATVIHTELTALSSAAKEWVLFALDLLVDNPVTGLNEVDAVKRLIAYAPVARYRAVGNPDNNFENEALSVSGWFEKALTSGLTKPTGVKASFVQQRLSTGSGGGSTCPSPRTAALDVAKLKSDMPVELEAYLKKVQVISNTKNQPMAPLQKLGDAVQERARSFYAPYADHSRGKGNTFVQQWQYSSHMVSSQSAAGTPGTELRVAYLDSRARIVGDQGLFATVNFDSSCDADNTELETIVTQMETKANIQALIDPILRQKSYTNQNVTPKQVIINPQVSAQTDDCEARWKTVRTICHELMHVLVHDDFRKAEKGRMVMREGWPEVLGHYLYEDITGDAAMKPKMEDGLASKPCASVPGSTIGYGDAGKKAEEIRIAIKNPNFRAAFFLGQLELGGIQPKLSVGTSNDPLEHEADRIADRAVSPSVEATAAPTIKSYRNPVATDLEAPASVNHVVNGSGRPLEPAVRRDMETRLGHDFSRVRVHSDAGAAQSARTINAEAYTAGHSIVFGPGKFAPSTQSGRRLLAHELVHVVQQSDSRLVQRKSSSAESDVSPLVHSVLRTPGQPLDAKTRKFMEPRLGQDFSRVRVHTDERAAQSARAVDALAYTFQNHLVLDNQSLPDRSYARQRVLAHELSHVVQQSRHGEPKEVGMSSDVAAETHADNAAQQVMRGHRVNVGDSAGSALMRIPRSAFRSVSPQALSDAEIETEIREIEEYVGSSPLSPETVDHLNLSRNALVEEQQKRRGLPVQAEKSPATGLAVPTTPAKPQPPFYDMKAADDAFSGIKLEYTVDSLPSGGQVEHTFKRGPYLIALNQKVMEDGSKRISYYIAYRRKEAVLIGEGGWNEYVIGPDSIEQFLSNMKIYEGVAAGPYAGGPPSPYQAESGKAVQKMMEGDVGGSVRSLGRAWVEAFKDPNWWASAVVATAGALPGRVPVKAPPVPLRSIPGGRPGPVPIRVGPAGRPVVASGPKPIPAQAPVAQAGPVVRGGAAPRLAPVPVPEPVPAAPPVPRAVPDIAKPSAPAPRGSLSPAVGAVGAAGASAAKPSPKTSPAPQPKPDETKRRNCMQQNPGAQVCDEPLRAGPDMMEETLVDFLLSQKNKDFAPDDLGNCYKFGKPIPAGEIDDCGRAPAIRYHCSVKGDPRTISIFGCLCCDIQGNTHYQWSWPHWSAK